MKTITYQLIKLIVFAVVSLSTYIDTNAQQFDFVPTDNLSRNSSTFRDNLNSFKSYTVPTLEIKNYLASSSNQLEISFRLGSDLTLQLELQKDETLVSGMSVNVGTDHGTVPFELNTANILTYYGYVKGDYASMVRLTFTDNMVFGIIKNGNDDNFTYIEPDFQADNSNGVVHAMYKSSDVKDGSRFSCNAVETEELLDNVVEDQHNRTIESNERAGLCYVAELAIANDYSMLTRYSTVANVVSRNVALMNNVQGLYLNNFDDDINFKIVNQFVATSNAADPVATTYTLASDILSQFKTWGNAGGFGSGVTYDLAQFWSTRSMGGPVGLAYVGSSVICGTSRYHILSDFSTISQVITVATAHEIGHNFNASHDASGSSFIMAPVSTITTTWSPTSLATISTTIVAKGTSGCFHQCYLEGAPISNFTSSYSDICLGGNVTYVSSSFNGPSSYSWTFDGGSPSSSSIKNPSITYNSLGFYDATLTASNITGTGNTLTKSKHVGVFESPTPICIPSNPSSATGGITSFSLGTIVSNTSNSAVSGGYENYICTRTTRLSPSTPYTFSITVGNSASSIFEKIRIYIDYNNDGDFGDSGELAFTTNTTGYIGTVSNLSFTTPASPTKNQLLMMRVIADNSSATTPCPTLGSGQVEDYAVVFYDASQQVLPPIAYESQAGTLNTVASNVNTNTWYKIMSNGYILAEVNPQSNQLGNVTLRLDDCTFVPTDPNGNFFIPRVFNFDCDGPDCVGGNFPNGNVKVRLYFYQNELTDLNTAGGTNLIPSQLNILYYSSNINEDCDLSNNTPANGSFGFISSSVVGAIASSTYVVNGDNGFFLEFNMPHFTEIATTGAIITLPVSLISLNSKPIDEGSLIYWSTSSEKDNAYYSIERSIDGVTFKTIGRVSGKGNTNSESYYTFIDNSPLDGLNYYRLKQIDIDGKENILGITQVEFKPSKGLNVYPNPSEFGNINVELYVNNSEDELKIEIYNISGQTVFMDRRSLNEGQNVLQYHFDDLPSGRYFIRAVQGEKSLNSNWVKQ